MGRKDLEVLFGKRIKREKSKFKYDMQFTHTHPLFHIMCRHFNLFQSHEAVVKALAEDPSVFEYDNIYDDLQEKKKKSDPRLQKKDTRVCQQPSIVCSYSNYGSCV